MKTKMNLWMLIMVCLSLLSSICSTDDVDDGFQNNEDQSAIELRSIATSGSWVILSYIDSGDNETSDFTGYSFTFSEDGVVEATNGSNTLQGTWSITSDDDSDDDSNSDDELDFNIFFSVPDDTDFEDLNDDWEITSYNQNTISLFDVSGGDGTTDTLVFTRN